MQINFFGLSHEIAEKIGIYQQLELGIELEIPKRFYSHYSRTRLFNNFPTLARSRQQCFE